MRFSQCGTVESRSRNNKEKSEGLHVPSLGVGLATSLSLRTSGGPYFVYTIAFIRIPPDLSGFVIMLHSYDGYAVAILYHFRS